MFFKNCSLKKCSLKKCYLKKCYADLKKKTAVHAFKKLSSIRKDSKTQRLKDSKTQRLKDSVVEKNQEALLKKFLQKNMDDLHFCKKLRLLGEQTD